MLHPSLASLRPRLFRVALSICYPEEGILFSAFAASAKAHRRRRGRLSKRISGREKGKKPTSHLTPSFPQQGKGRESKCTRLTHMRERRRRRQRGFLAAFPSPFPSLSATQSLAMVSGYLALRSLKDACILLFWERTVGRGRHTSPPPPRDSWVEKSRPNRLFPPFPPFSSGCIFCADRGIEK